MVLKFVKKLALYVLICLGIITFVLETQGRYIDLFYKKFTTPKVNSIIIGDSRGIQDLVPHVINKSMSSTDFSLPIYNYSFTIDQARIGPLYRKSVLKKITQTDTKGLFLISLTPMMLSSYIKNSNESGEFSEAGQPPHNMHFVDKKPNYEYFIKNINYFEFKAIFKRDYILEDDGWLKINHLDHNKHRLNAWKKIQMDGFKKMAKMSKPSEYRMKSLDTLVKTLKKYGDVYLLRSPIDADFLDLENTYFKDFNEKINQVANANNIRYFNFGATTNSHYFAFDGHHLDIKSAELFTKHVCDSILKYK